jgi:hypothetical protein
MREDILLIIELIISDIPADVSAQIQNKTLTAEDKIVGLPFQTAVPSTHSFTTN